MGNVVKVRWNWSVGDIPDVYCIAHVQAAPSHDPASSDEVASLAQAAFQWWKTRGPGDFLAGAEVYGDAIRLQEIATQRLQPSVGDEYLLPAEGWAGTLPTDGVGLPGYAPPQCSALLSLRGTSSTRSTRGRLYLPAMQWSLDPAEQVEGRIPDVYVGFLGSVFARMAEAFRLAPGEDEAEWVLAVYSRLAGTSQSVTHCKVGTWLRTQRGRAITPQAYRTYGLDATEE